MANEKKPTVTKYYFSKSAKHILGGWIPEQIAQATGKRIRGEQGLQFQNHWIITDDPKKQKFIEANPHFNQPSTNPFIREYTEDEFNQMQVKLAKRFVENVAVTPAG